MKKFIWALGFPFRLVCALCLSIIGVFAALIKYEAGQEFWAEAWWLVSNGFLKEKNSRFYEH